MGNVFLPSLLTFVRVSRHLEYSSSDRNGELRGCRPVSKCSGKSEDILLLSLVVCKQGKKSVFQTKVKMIHNYLKYDHITVRIPRRDKQQLLEGNDHRRKRLL